MSLPKKISEVELKHEKFMSEEGLIKANLPKPFQTRIGIINAQKSKFDNNPSESTLKAIRTMSAQLAIEMQKWSDDKEGSGGGAPPAAAGAAAPAPPADDTAAAEQEAEKKRAAEEEAAKNTPFKKALSEGKGKIYHDTLKKIVGKKEIGNEIEVEGILMVRRVAYYYQKNK